jgi:serine/threonine protein phosphatase PrpC
MNFLISASSDVGIKKKKNQDSLVVKCISIDGNKAVLAVLCDGVGGLERGELASASVANAFGRWQEERLPEVFYGDARETIIREEWQGLLSEYNVKIKNYGYEHGISLGTTVTAILIMQGKYYIVNVGDSRIYEIKEQIRQLTKDQTIVEYELANGIITPEQAKSDSRKSVLLQCVGVSDTLIPDYFTGEVETGAVYMLCSDGFIHKISEEEIYQYLNPDNMDTESQMKENEKTLIKINKQRQETDNISVITIRTI